jgi:hypothetical protein
VTGYQLRRAQPIILGQAELLLGSTGSGDDVHDLRGLDLGEGCDQVLDQIGPAGV